MLRATWLERDEAKAELDSCILRVCCSDVGAARGFFLSILHLSLPSLSPSFPSFLRLFRYLSLHFTSEISAWEKHSINSEFEHKEVDLCLDNFSYLIFVKNQTKRKTN